MENMEEIAAMLGAVAQVKEEPKAETKSSYEGGGNKYGKKQSLEDLPNIYNDFKIEPMEIDKTKLKNSYTYSIVAIDENPSQEISDVLGRISDVLKAKRFVYRYNGESTPSISKNILRKQDLTMPDSYQVFLPWLKADNKEFDDVTITSKRPSFLAARIAKHLTMYKRKDENNPEVKHTEYGFSKCSGAVRNILANNIHMYLGKDCLTKLNFLILYSADGVEKVEEINKETTNRRAADVVRIAETIGIPVFNIGKSDGTKRLLEYINKD